MINADFKVVERCVEDVGAGPLSSNDFEVGVERTCLVTKLQQQYAYWAHWLKTGFDDVVTGLSGKWVVAALCVFDVLVVGAVVFVVVVRIYDVADGGSKVGFLGNDPSKQLTAPG